MAFALIFYKAEIGNKGSQFFLRNPWQNRAFTLNLAMARLPRPRFSFVTALLRQPTVPNLR